LNSHFAAIGLAALALGACAEPSPEYPSHYEFAFMQACEAQDPLPGLCACTWDKIEANFARRDFDALERMSADERAADPRQAQIEGYALECGDSLTSPEGPPT
jgi:hypothetical protein